MITEEATWEQKYNEAAAEVAACIQFMYSEMHWEGFRIEMLYHEDAKKANVAEENIRLLKNYLMETRHGIRFLKEYERMKAELEKKA